MSDNDLGERLRALGLRVNHEALTAFLPPIAEISKSSLAPYFLAGAHAVSFVVPHDLRQLILDGAAQIKHTAPDWIKQHE